MKFINITLLFFLGIVQFHLFSLDEDEILDIMTGSWVKEVESNLPDYMIELNLSRSNFGKVFDNNGKHLVIDKSIHNNFDFLFSYEILENIGLSTKFSNIYHNEKFKAKTIDLDLFSERYKLGFSFDLLGENKKWATNVRETDGFTQVYFQYNNNFSILNKIRNNYSIGYKQIFHDEYKEINNLDIIGISKFNNRSVLYISNKVYKSFILIDIGFDILFNYYRAIRINGKRTIKNTNGYIFSLSPIIKLKFPSESIFLEISSVSKYENIRIGIPIIGKNSLCPTATIQ